jgi:hypothetical protein
LSWLRIRTDHFVIKIEHLDQHLIMLEVADVRWCDLGTPESIERTYRAMNLVPIWNLPSSVANPIPSLKSLIRAQAAAKTVTDKHDVA